MSKISQTIRETMPILVDKTLGIFSYIKAQKLAAF